MPFYAATLARARLAKAQERLAEALRDPVARGDAWPPARVLLLLKLWATVFPASGACGVGWWRHMRAGLLSAPVVIGGFEGLPACTMCLPPPL